jgi:hypothetical protein
MPLKHATETALVFLLGAVVLITGLVAALLPPPAQAPAWWAIAIIAALAYPLALYPVFKSRRADYPFRALHFAPLAILLIRFALEFGAGFVPALKTVAALYVLAWTAPALIVVFALLIIFCWQVLRQRGQRIRFLLATLIPFVLFGALARNVPPSPVGPPIVALNGSSASSVSSVSSSASSDTIIAVQPSTQPSEEAWRMQLRRRERRSSRIAAREERIAEGDWAGLIRGAKDGVAAIAGLLGGGAMSSSGTSSSSGIIVAVQPPNLPASGPELAMLGIPLLAGYCTVLQKRAARRKNL